MKNKPLYLLIGLLALIFLSQLYIIFRAINPLNDIAIANERKLVETAAKGAGTTIGDFQYMAELGKTKGFEDIDKLKKLSKYNEEVYKDAQKGDRAIAFSDKMVLYRPSGSKIVYQGETPGQKQLKDQQQLVLKLVERVKGAGYIPADSQEVPQIATINNAEQLKDNAFYKGAENGDLVLIFNNAGAVVVYSVKQDKPLNAAKTQLVPMTNPSPEPTKK